MTKPREWNGFILNEELLVTNVTAVHDMVGGMSRETVVIEKSAADKLATTLREILDVKSYTNVDDDSFNMGWIRAHAETALKEYRGNDAG